MRDLKYTETFYSAQGEGAYVGIPSLWFRFYSCNLECRGFGQDDPTDPSTYKPVGNDIDITNIEKFSDLPVFTVGCDSAYSVSKVFRKLAFSKPPAEAVDDLTALLPHGSFTHPKTGQPVHMVFTGGEPMMPGAQRGIIAVMREFEARGNLPMYVTIETNGTKHLTDDMKAYIAEYRDKGGEWYWSLSPKLWATAGEKPEKAIKPDVLGEYATVSPRGQIKYVVNGTVASWQEVEANTGLFRDAGCDFPVWIMPEGATEEAQLGVDRKMSAGDIAHDALARGYNVSPRVHVYLWGNAIGV